LDKNAEALKLEGPTDMVQNITWNWDGSIAGVSSKDRELRLYDPRANKVVNVSTPKIPQKFTKLKKCFSTILPSKYPQPLPNIKKIFPLHFSQQIPPPKHPQLIYPRKPSHMKEPKDSKLHG
jgi:hypothetical protein